MRAYILIVQLLIAVSVMKASTLRNMHNILPETVELNIAQDNGQMGELVEAFLKRQKKKINFTTTGLNNIEYLRQIERQVRAFYYCQDKVTGAIIDPVYKIEWQYSTPCYALSVGLLIKSGYLQDVKLLESGIKALECSVNEMYEDRCAHNHGEFFIQPIMLSLDIYQGLVSQKKIMSWLRKIANVDPYVLYKDNLRRKKYCYNHNVVALSGEYLRIKKKLCKDEKFFDIHLKHQQQYFSDFGLYIDNKTNPPMAYDEFTRQFLASILVEGYNGPYFDFYARTLHLGAWTSLFMQSPYGEIPTGGRSSQHLWNEAAAAVTYEIYASQYAVKGEKMKAGAFKRAAHLALKSIGRWKREDGSGFIVKNRFPIEVMHGYESYSAQSQYNLLACWLMSVAYLYADDSIKECPAPSDVGGYVLVIKDVFHKIFANSNGNYIEYELSGDPRYNSTGLIRVHLKESNPQLGPSDGISHKWDNKRKKDLGGDLYAIGPAWYDTLGKEHRLAEYTNILFSDSNLYSAYQSNVEPVVEVETICRSDNKLEFEVIYKGDFEGVTQISQLLSIDKNGVSVRDCLIGDVQKMRIYYPILIYDGFERTQIKIQNQKLKLGLRDGDVCFQVIEPDYSMIKRKRKKYSYRNGYANIVYAESFQKVMKYKISNSFN